MKLKAKDTLLFVGDSITDCGRQRPLGERDGAGMGYVRLVDAILGGTGPNHPLRILNTGIGGNRVTDLAARWESDVMEHQPDWVSIMIGINDVWRHFDRPFIEQVDLEQFRNTLENLIEKTIPKVDGLILMTPFFIEPNTHDPMRSKMDDYSRCVQDLAQKHNTLFVDIQAAFDNYLKQQSNQTLAHDRIHPNLQGHMVIAKAFLDAIDFQWNTERP